MVRASTGFTAALLTRLTGIVTPVDTLTDSMECADHAVALADLKSRVRGTLFTVQRRANIELVRLSWRSKKTPLERQGNTA